MKQYTYDEVLQASLKYFNNDQLAATTWINKYAKRDKDNNLVELTPDDMHKRLAKAFFDIEKNYINNDKSNNDFSEYYKRRKDLTEDSIYQLFKNFNKVIPAGSVMSGLGSDKPVSLSNCFVLPSPEDSYSSIMLTRLKQVELMKRRGGVGYDLSNLRPRDAEVHNAAVTSTGAASFMSVCSDVTNEVAQQGRRGALMLSLDIRSCDIKEFIEKKQDLTKVTGANVSVQVTDDFMNAVKNNEDYFLRWPVDSCINFYLTEKANGIKTENLEYDKLYKMVYTDNEFTSVAKQGYMKKVKAKELWDTLIHCAWNTAEPGILFKDKHLNFSPDGIYDKYKGISTNPCITGNTKIFTNSGEYTVNTILDKFNKNENIQILSFNINTNKVEYQKLINIQLTRKNTTIIEIEYLNAYTKNKTNKIKLTPEHKIYTVNRDYVEAKDLNTEDILLMYNPETQLVEETYLCTINSVNNEDVYDLTVDKNHNFFANQLLIKNCGEIFMSGGESCRLLCINMLSFIDNPYTNKATINIDKVYSLTYESMRLADDLVDLELNAVSKIMDIVKNDTYAYDLWKLIFDKGKDGRRVGLEFTALSDMVAALNINFCSEKGNKTVEQVCKLMQSACLDCQVDMAIERGAFNDQDLDIEKHFDNDWYQFIKNNYPYRYEHMMKYGRRNISYTTVGPCGSISIMTQTSSGIEPLFMPYYVRRRKCMNKNDRVDFTDNLGVNFTEFVVVHPQLKNWAILNISDYTDFENLTIKDWEKIYKQSPWFNSCAPDINWEKRVELQAIVQKNLISHSISSCITADTLIETDNGYYYLDEIFNINAINEEEFKKNTTFVNKVKSHDNTYNNIKSFYNNGKKDVFTLTLLNDLYITCTSNEKFLVFDEDNDTFSWKELSQIQEGDKIKL